MNDRSTILSSLRSFKLSLVALPLAFASGACDEGVSQVGTGGMGAAPTSGGSGGVSASGGSAGSAGGGAGGTGGTAGTGGTPPLGGEPNVPDTVECAGPFPTDDVSAAVHKATASAATSWGALPHFWTTFGLGRIGLYLDQADLAAEHQAQDKLNHDGLRWSQVLKDHTLDAIQNLGLTSIRAHGLFHDDIGIYKEVNGEPVYDFTRSDKIFDFLVQNNVAPIIELASMPAALASNPSQTVFDWKMIVSPPKDYDRWQGLVQAFVQHSVDKYGADVVQKWYFEVWNEPECCSGKFWKGTFDDYLKLYDKAAAGVRAVLPNGRVGGPVSSQAAELTGNSMSGIKFLDHVNATSAPFDFFTFHTWNFLDGAVNGYFTGLELLDSKQHNTVQIAVTEFGPTWEFGLIGGSGEPAWEPQETNQGAAFVAQIYSNIAQRCAKEGKRFPITYAWWTLSDVFDEGYEDQGDYVAEENPFIGAMGLLNRESIRKPAYNAYKFLAQLGDEQMELTVEGAGDVGGMAARDRTDSGVQIILYNGQDPGDGFSSDTYYQTAAAQDIGITVSGLNPEVTYDVTAYRIDETHGNSFGAWEGLGKKKMAEMTDADWTTLRTAMDAPAEPVGTAMCGTTFSKTFSLSSPGVILLTIEPSLPK
jgi:beta-xylosidase